MSEKPKLMLVGAGGLGETILELLVRDNSLREIAVCDINQRRGFAVRRHHSPQRED